MKPLSFELWSGGVDHPVPGLGLQSLPTLGPNSELSGQVGWLGHGAGLDGLMMLLDPPKRMDHRSPFIHFYPIIAFNTSGKPQHESTTKTERVCFDFAQNLRWTTHPRKYSLFLSKAEVKCVPSTFSNQTPEPRTCHGHAPFLRPRPKPVTTGSALGHWVGRRGSFVFFQNHEKELNGSDPPRNDLENDVPDGNAEDETNPLVGDLPKHGAKTWVTESPGVTDPCLLGA